MDLIKELVDYTFPSNLSDNLLQKYLTHFGLDFDIDRSIDEVTVWHNEHFTPSLLERDSPLVLVDYLD